MALTAQEEALVRQLLDEQAAILSLAGSEATILSKLGATKVTLSGLTAASTVADADLLLMRQGTTDKSVSGTVLSAYTTGAVPAASETVQGKIEISSVAESQALTDLVRALTPGRLASAFQGSNQSLSSNGYQKIPGGLILQWGNATGTGSGTITFPIAFTTACYFCGVLDLCAIGGTPAYVGTNPTTSNFTWQQSPTANIDAFNWFAIGR